MRVNGAFLREIYEKTHIMAGISVCATFFHNRLYIGTLVYGREEYEDFGPCLIPDEWFGQA